MDRLISCEFNMDTACVELKFLDGSMIAIDTIAVENEVADNMYQRSELDYLIYNDPVDEEVCLFGGEVFQNPEKASGIPHLLIGAKVRALILELG